MFCRNCGFELMDNHKFCPYCGQKVIRPASDGGLKTDVSVEYEPPMPEKTAETPPKAEYDFCKCCGQKVLASEEKCPFCGRKLVKTDILRETPHYGYKNQSDTPKRSGSGTLVSVLAIVAAFIPFLGFMPSILLGVAGILIGVTSKNKLSLVLGIVAIVIAVVYLVLFIGVIIILAGPDVPVGIY